MMTCDNYVLKRQSLKLLSEFLLDRENFRVMMRFIGDKCVTSPRTTRACLPHQVRPTSHWPRGLPTPHPPALPAPPRLSLLLLLLLSRAARRLNLKTIMMMLRHKQPNIQFEAFHVFKVRALWMTRQLC